MKSKILVYQFNEVEQKLLKERVDSSFGELSFVSSLKELESIELKEYRGAILCFSNDNVQDCEMIFEILAPLPVIAYLRDKSYQAAMTSYRHNAIYLFDGELTPKDIEASQIKLQMFYDELNSDIPRFEIIKLFESPLKLKHADQFYQAMSLYFGHFKEVKNYGIISFLEDETISFGRIEGLDELEKLKSCVLPRHFIGHNEILRDEDLVLMATPVYEQDEKYEWLVVEVEKSQKDFILNDLFYKFLENILIYRKSKDKERNLEKLAKTDDVTGLFNQRKLAEDLEQAITSHAKEHDTFSIMFIDVDHFKEVNDNHGHIIGSNLLSELGNVLSLILRKSDHIYRYGGDEFVVIMPKINISTVHEVATRVLEKVKDYDFTISKDEFYKMSVSIGIAEYPTDASSAVEIIKFADEMMYKSKKSGRGKVFHLKEVGAC